MNNPRDDLKDLICTLEDEELTAEDAGAKLFKMLEESYREFLEPTLIEDNVFDKTAHRKRGESITIFLQRKRKILVQFEKCEVDYLDNG